MEHGESHFIRKAPCPNCGSRDNLAIYSDGHGHCFGCGHRTKGDGEAAASTSRKPLSFTPNPGDAFAESKRGITPETFQHWRYQSGTKNGRPMHIANHFKNGELIGQKIRFADKTFAVEGKLDTLYGRWLWPTGGRMVVVTEGEIDALSVSQAQGNKWPVVSVPNGAPAAAASFRKSIDWLESFEKVVIMFDEDDVGRAAALECAAILSPGKAFIATLPLKDPNELLKAGRTQDLVSAVWNAKPYRPDGIVSLADVRDAAMRPVEWGRPWVFPTLTAATYGRRDGETYFIGAGTGVGKTDVLTEQIAFDLQGLNLNVGLLFLEQDPTETVKRLAGKIAGKRFHIPEGYTPEELALAIDTLGQSGQVYLYDNFGSTEWKTVRERIRYMAVALGCKHIYLDHLTALAAHAEDERKALEEMTAEIAMLAKQLRIVIHVVSHLSTPEKGSHEEGARVQIKHFKGSRAIGFWAHFMFGLERNQQAEDERMRHVTTFRVLKDRYTGLSTGITFYLKYDHETGRLSETSLEEAQSGPVEDDTPF